MSHSRVQTVRVCFTGCHQPSKTIYISSAPPFPPRSTTEISFRAAGIFCCVAMGMCSSCEATTVVPIMTAKLVLINGELREFACPVKAAHALQKDEEFFVCDADEMEFGGFVTAVPDNVELRLGQIYFVLPRSMLRQPLQAADIAALAVKASSALMRAAPEGETPLVFSATRSEQPAKRTAERRRRKRSGGSGRSFESNLSSILE